MPKAVRRAGLVAIFATAQAATLIDHHQHLASPQALSVFSFTKPATGADMIARMDVAGIGRASRERLAACRSRSIRRD